MADKKHLEIKPIQGIRKRIKQFQESGQWDKVSLEYKRLTEFMPVDPEVRKQYAESLYKVNQGLSAVNEYIAAAKFYEDNSEFDKTVAVLKKALKIKPTMVDIQIRIGDLLAKIGKTGEAIERFKEISKNFSDRGSHDEALVINKKIINLQPDDLITHRKYAEILEKIGKMQQAVVEYKSLTKKVREKGLDIEALNLMKKIIDLDPTSIHIAHDIVYILLKTGQIDQASEEIKNLLQQFPDSAKAYMFLGDILTEKGEKDRAIKAYLKSNSIKPNQTKILVKMIQTHIDIGELNQALDDATTLVRLYLKENNIQAAKDIMMHFQDQDFSGYEYQEDYVKLLLQLDMTDNITVESKKLCELYQLAHKDEEAEALEEIIQNQDYVQKLKLLFLHAQDSGSTGEVYDLLGDILSQEVGDQHSSSVELGLPLKSIDAATLKAIIPEHLKASGQRKTAKVFESTIELDINVGKALYNMGLFKEAIREFSRLLNDPKTASRANAWIGICNKELGQDKLAEEFFKRVTDPEVQAKLEKYQLYKYEP
ncbi:tetratricopeptide repeat protein [candidate division CSSED10-310 bacterium]|uniref:Tetratricopeptide repeat protein n=1 Tax=candidate division CSSED10-310 bacterium TaxID=2855610 RepID=A0ABV6Z309_UNCC1